MKCRKCGSNKVQGDKDRFWCDACGYFTDNMELSDVVCVKCGYYIRKSELNGDICKKCNSTI